VHTAGLVKTLMIDGCAGMQGPKWPVGGDATVRLFGVVNLKTASAFATSAQAALWSNLGMAGHRWTSDGRNARQAVWWPISSEIDKFSFRLAGKARVET